MTDKYKEYLRKYTKCKGVICSTRKTEDISDIQKFKPQDADVEYYEYANVPRWRATDRYILRLFDTLTVKDFHERLNALSSSLEDK